MKKHDFNCIISQISKSKLSLLVLKFAIIFSLILGNLTTAAGTPAKCTSSVSNHVKVVAKSNSDRLALKKLIELRHKQLQNEDNPKNETFTYEVNGTSFNVRQRISTEFNVTHVFRTRDGKNVVKDYNFNKDGSNLDYFYRELLLIEYLKSKGIPVLEPALIDAKQAVLVRPFYTAFNIYFEKGQTRSAKLNEALERAGLAKSLRLSQEFTNKIEIEIEKVLFKLRDLYYQNEKTTHPMLRELKKLFVKLKKKYSDAILTEDDWLLKADYYTPGNLILLVKESGVEVRVLDP